jgi:large subunit ribosomal protein L17
MVSSLFLHGRITTTPAKAKEARPFAEKLITLAKKGDLAARRRAFDLLHNKSIVTSLFNEIGPRYANRAGGYTRILHLAKTRVGDSAPQAIFELVEEAKGGSEKKVAAVNEAAATAETVPVEAPAPVTEEQSATEASEEKAE